MPSVHHLVETQISDDEISLDEDETSHLNNTSNGSRKSSQDPRGWDVFIENPPAEDDLTQSSKVVEVVLKIIKVFVYVLILVCVMATAVISKGTMLFMTSHIQQDRTIPVCKKGLGLERDKDYEVKIPDQERVAWIWCLFFAMVVPELFTHFRSSRICIFKSYRKPQFQTFITVLLTETLHVLGLALLVFVVLPDLDVIKAVMLTNCVCFMPALFSLLSHHKDEEKRPLKVVLDILSIIFQATGFVIWPIVEHYKRSWTIPVAVFLISFTWWENFVDKKSPVLLIKKLANIKEDLRKSRYFTYIFISIWKTMLIFCSMLAFLYMTMENLSNLFQLFKKSFQPHPIRVHQVRTFVLDSNLPDLPTASPIDEEIDIDSLPMAPIYVTLIQVTASLLCYIFSKFACKICIQGFSFAFPISLTVPVTMSLLIAACGIRSENECLYEDILPKYLFWTCPNGDFFQDFVSKQHAWIWLLWLLSQTWIAIHIWTPKCERLASTEKLFVNPMYIGVLVDQSLAFNRRRDDMAEIKISDIDLEVNEYNDSSQYYETISVNTIDTSSSHNDRSGHSVRNVDHITRIYTCATMWHETPDEMIQMLKSVMRLDEDQSARRNAQKYLSIIDPDYYELEVHIYFDDAFELSDDNDEEMVVNRFVKQLIRVIDVAASNVHQTNIRLKPPKKLPTPFGGRLIWTMPGKNKLIAHLKDKLKIRHRKRWSQVMYMYYLLGHRLMELPIDVNRKEVIAENTFILTLDGDINFRPHAVQLLVDLMKKNRSLGAACGRIHPVGRGPMVWYQKFEYAIGHWLQKATEHMIGCVLCSPGCFSLFRAKALMDDNVMRRYTTKSEDPLHYVQYDQGEDRWLCTLMLQRGYRVEYSAASDAYTHCPEGFGEFYTQRRRWAPSTMANIMDLLGDYKRTVSINDSISIPYIIYQGMLMVGTVLGPGTIFLMLVGAMVAAFKISNWTSFTANIVPILFFIFICFVANNNIQILIAQIFSSAYALLMMAVLVGTSIQLSEDGVGSPSSIFLIGLSSSFFIAAIIHPQEFWCVVPGLLYFISVPSMYLLLILYSLVNLNVVSWGTREIQTKKSKKQVEEERKEVEEMKKTRKKKSDLFGFLGMGRNEDEEDGSITFSLANLFKCMICTYPKASEEKIQLLRISDQLESLNTKISSLERQLDIGQGLLPGGGIKRRSSMGRRSDRGSPVAEGENGGFESDSEDTDSERLEPRVERDDLINPYWIEDKDLKRGEVEYLNGPEIQFWKDMIEKYLYPLDQNKEHEARVASELKELRNKVVFGFLMSNALFILIVFLLQLNKDQLHINWPLGVKTNITYIPETSEIRIDKEYLQLEPIGLVFATFFAIILIVQFLAMLFHRFGTLSHILASIELTCCNQKVEDLTEDAFFDKNAIQIARQLQKLKGLEDDDKSEDYGSGDRLARRRTIQNLEKRRQQKTRVGTLDVAFRKRFMNISPENEMGTPVLSGFHRRKDTLKVLADRRSSLMKKSGQMETLGARNQFSNPPSRQRGRLDKILATPDGTLEGFRNTAFEGSSDEENGQNAKM
ncbi:chitin synthase chs-2-like [Tachypleus tridentatus]|uniref:chitin synthase chs-2-like n=1 Tax=Tachypleus tridentatus TaxID=6853 RepID=UPI003FCF978F